MASRKKPGQKQLQKLLTESVFNPDSIGPLKIIADLRNAGYCEIRAIELIQEARLTPFVPDGDNSHYHDKIKQAISLLVLARAERQHGTAESQKQS